MKWKCAIVVAVQEIQGTNNSKEYRSIDIIPVYEKVLEAIVKRLRCEHLENNNILSGVESECRHNCCGAVISTFLDNSDTEVDAK